jgi:hypothetical protein
LKNPVPSIDTVPIENRPRLADLLDRLFGVVLAPDVAHLCPLEPIVGQKLGGRRHVVVDFVGGDSEFDIGQGQRPQPAGKQRQRGRGESFAAGKTSHVADYIVRRASHCRRAFTAVPAVRAC